MRKTLLALFVLLAFAGIAHGATYTAASASYADVNACVNSGAAATCSPGGTHTVINGDIVNVPCGSATWASGLNGPSGVWFTLQFGSGCAVPNSGSSTNTISAACGTGTVITDNAGLTTLFDMTPTYGSGSLMRISCLDIEPTAQNLGAPITIYGTCTSSGCPGFRIDNVYLGKTTAWTEGNNGSAAAEVFHLNDVFGSMDHNTDNPASNIAMFVSAFSTYLGVGIDGDNSWAQANSLGGPNNVFAEYNTWYTGYFALDDCEAPSPDGCRTVVRNNRITCTGLSSCFGITVNHGTDTSGRGRGGVEEESYNNTYTLLTGVIAAGIYGMRSGTGMFHDDTVVMDGGNTVSAWLNMNLYRNVFASSPWSSCGGLNSIDPWDLNNNTVFYGPVTATVSGGSPSLTFTVPSSTGLTITNGAPYTLYDLSTSLGGVAWMSEITSISGTTITILRPISESSWYDGGNGGVQNGDNVEIIRSTYCIDQEGRTGPSTYLSGTTPSPTGWVNETLTPVYQWGDTVTGGHANNGAGADSNKLILGRDFFPQTATQTAQTSASAPFNGTTTCTGGSCGVGWGTLANRPASCTPNPTGSGTGVGYGEYVGGVFQQFDFCIATNIWSTLTSSPPSYTNYTNPHPFDGGTPQALAPSCTPTSGVVPQTVTCTNPNSGTTIMCKAVSPTNPSTNGLGTACSTGTQYTGAITVSSAETLNVVAGVNGDTDSTISSYTYSAAATAPTVTTTTATGITTTTASAGGTVTATGGASITSEGTCYATTANPTTPCTSDGTATPFTSSLSGLSVSTTYFYRAFATNSAGTSYGADLSFTTLGTCATPVTIGIYTDCSENYNDATGGTTVTTTLSPFAGNGIYVVVSFCGTGCTVAPPASTITMSDNVNNPETCFTASPHSPFSMANPAVPDYETIWVAYCPSIPSGVTNFTATISNSVNVPQLDVKEFKAGTIATTGFFENVDALSSSGGTAGVTATVTTSGPTTNANDLIVAFLANCGATNPASPGAGYTGLIVNPTTSFGTVNGHVLEAAGVTTTGTKSATSTWSSGTAPASCQQGAGGANATWFGVITPMVSVNGSVILSPATNNFGSVNVGSSSASQTFTITNNNATTATAISASTGSALFPVTNTGAGSCSAAGGSLAEGASCTVTVKFSPSASGLVTGTLTVSYSGGDGASPITSALSGTGVNSPAATPTCSPAGGTFTSTSGPIVCTETGGAPLTCYNATGYIAINGAISCPAGSTHYTGAFVINSSQKLYIWAGGSGFADSPESTYTFTINLPLPPAPTIKILVQNTQTEKVPITNSLTLNGETATLGPQTHTLTISTSCTCTVATATGVVTGCVCPQTVSVTN